ncbi:MAG: hypothetical protein P8R42_06995 [Candidatus Binatia bacterium]|nr:hypothetical protein [Candidatus Binatia bacterium]
MMMLPKAAKTSRRPQKARFVAQKNGPRSMRASKEKEELVPHQGPVPDDHLGSWRGQVGDQQQGERDGEMENIPDNSRR